MSKNIKENNHNQTSEKEFNKICEKMYKKLESRIYNELFYELFYRMNDKIHDEIYNDDIDKKMYDKIYYEISDEISDEISELYTKTYNEMKGKITNEVGEKIFYNAYNNIYNEMYKRMKHEMNDEIHAEMPDDKGVCIDKNTRMYKSINDITLEKAIRLEAKGVEQIVIAQKAYTIKNNSSGYWQRRPYDIDTFINIRLILHEFTKEIPPTLPEKEKFAEIYKSICYNIAYDYPAGYPKTNEEKQYADENVMKCRDLTNGLLKGKCVCSGYADILRTALNLVGVEAVLVDGNVKTSKNILTNFLKKQIKKNAKDEVHAWVKVKLDGKWYNADPTWDTDYIRNGQQPHYALQTDEECTLNGKYNFVGPECNTSFPKKEKEQLFKTNQNIEQDVEELKPKNREPILKIIIKGFKNIRMIYVGTIKQARSLLKGGFGKKQKLLPTQKKVVEKEQEPIKTWNLTRWEFEDVEPNSDIKIHQKRNEIIQEENKKEDGDER